MKKILPFKILGVLFIIFPLVCGCDAIYRILQKEGAEERDLIGNVVPFESNPKVEEIQRILKIYGYGVGNPDGKMGHRTRSAIRQFQKDNNLKVSRFVDNATWELLTLFYGTGLIIDGEISTVTVQKALKNAGFNPGKIDGKEGPQTDRALRDFQKAMGLKVDGKIGFQTLIELNDFLPYE